MLTTITLNTSIDRRYTVSGAKLGSVNRVSQCCTTAGGKGLNVARIAHALEIDVLAGGLVGGAHGQFIQKQLAAEGIQQYFTQIDGESRCCINIIEEGTGVQTEFLEPGPTVTAAEFKSFEKDFDTLCKLSNAVTVSGSLPKGLPTTTYASLVERAHSHGKRLFLDVSGEPLRLALAAKPYYIKPNAEEIRTLSDSEPIIAAKELHATGIPWVVISIGKDGAILCCDEGTFRACPPKVAIVNTVGCGDAMTAAFAIASMEGKSAPDSLRYAIAVSAASAMSNGTGEVKKSTVEKLYKQIEVTSCH